MMDLLLETACEWWCLCVEAFIELRSYGEAFGPKRQISTHSQFFHFFTVVGRRPENQRIEARFLQI
jgi:hypothetical protein